jgi:hypothetical protein
MHRARIDCAVLDVNLHNESVFRLRMPWSIAASL